MLVARQVIRLCFFPEHRTFHLHPCTSFQVPQSGLLRVVSIAAQCRHVGLVGVGVSTRGPQGIVHHQVHLSEEGVEQQVHGTYRRICTLENIGFQGLDVRAIGLKDPTLKAQVEVAEVQVVVTVCRDQELQRHSPDLTWGWYTPGSHRCCLSVRAACFAGPVHCWCVPHRAVACRPEVTLCKNSWPVSERVTFGCASYTMFLW